MNYPLGIAVFAVACGGAIILADSFVKTQPESVSCALEKDDLGAFVDIPGGGFVQGDSARYPEEGPARKVFVSPFRIVAHEITNSQFAAFVAETGYVTDAERGEGSARFEASDTPEVPMSWWSLDPGSTWRTPNGKGSDLIGRELHPVIHVTLNDARAYARWAGGRIPTEVEWEYAASLGLFDSNNPESGMRSPDGEARANVWNGPFPALDLGKDGFSGLAPVGCYEPGLTGAYDMIGNVWEWTESPFGSSEPRFTIKGGSFLCSDSYCRRYRAAARQGMEGDFSSSHVGFRIVKSADTPAE
ncbi:formylglycine-generating enzyme family protein [Erythrobacter sp. MTPC3]|uniref:formylglycine-generating enzyme family protein n=1 Tax=Erythrobacter sp. MTPC3 TaxID=3056564 RepID=UPI0036F42CC5